MNQSSEEEIRNNRNVSIKRKKEHEESGNKTKNVRTDEDEKGENVDREEDSMEDINRTNERCKKDTKKVKYTTRFTGNDLYKYYNEKERHKIDELLTMLSIFKEEISIDKLELFKRKESIYLLITVSNEHDHKVLNDSDLIEIKDINGKVLLNLIKANTKINYMMAVTGFPINIQIRKHQKEMDEIKKKYYLSNLERKFKYDGIPLNTLIITTELEKTFIYLIKNGIKIRNRLYIVEPWVYKPQQCLKCGKLNHKREDCQEIEKCLKCSKDKHEGSCSKKDYKCILCSKKHQSYSKSCPVIIEEYKKSNKFYARILNDNDISNEKIDKIFKDARELKSGSGTDEEDSTKEEIHILKEAVKCLQKTVEENTLDISSIKINAKINESRISKLEGARSSIDAALELNFNNIKDLIGKTFDDIKKSTNGKNKSTGEENNMDTDNDNNI